MENKEFLKEYNKLSEKIEEMDKQAYKDYPEYPTVQRQGLDAGNHFLKKIR